MCIQRHGPGFTEEAIRQVGNTAVNSCNHALIREVGA